jgi:acetolactate synthase-1/2/3 large subunit
LFYGRRSFASNFAVQVDFAMIATGFGVPAYDLDATAEPLAMLEQAIGGDGPALIHATIDMDAKVFPMVPPGAANREMIEGEPLACA